MMEAFTQGITLGVSFVTSFTLYLIRHWSMRSAFFIKRHHPTWGFPRMSVRLEAVFFHSTYIMSLCSGDAHGWSASHSNQTLLFWGGIYIWILSEMLTLFCSPRHIGCADGRYWLMRYAAGCYIMAEKLWLYISEFVIYKCWPAAHKEYCTVFHTALCTS